MVSFTGRNGIASPLAVTLLLALSSQALAREEFYSERKACPVSCSSTSDPSQWTLYTSLQRLTYCHQPLLFEVSLSGDSPSTRSQLTRVRACTAVEADKGEEVIVNAILPEPEELSPNGSTRRSLECTSTTKNSTSVELATWGQQSSASRDMTLGALEELTRWVEAKKDCRPSPTVMFAYNNGTVVGYFAGERVQSNSAARLIKKLSDNVSKDGAGSRSLLQHCNTSGLNNTAVTSAVTVGVVVDTEGDFVAVQRAVRAWSGALCVEDADSTKRLNNVALNLFKTVQSPDTLESFYFTPVEGQLERRQGPAECRWIRVEDGDGCASLATRCGITGAQYMEFNSEAGHCANLAPGQPVCCSSGRLPEIRPRPNPDGSCFVHNVEGGDFCAVIAATNGLTIDDIYDFNKNTWGWSGCDPLALGISICLSPGDPPMPAPVDNAVCGPTKPGSRPPRGDQTLADLNPCLLKACCNIWGQCGTTADFCIESESETGAPGTAAPGTHGCVQNCGMDIVNNAVPAQIWRKLGYFEGWNRNRPCLHMDARATKNHKQAYTDVHFSFAHITEGPDYDVLIPDDVVGEWQNFLKITDGPAKTLAFGGWTFSAEAPTYHLFREATAPANRERFAENVVQFAIRYDLDGLDFDWEYPGAPDIPGIPPGGKDEGLNYLEFLKLVRAKLPPLKTLSIAAPASFWYLKQFPIAAMAPYLDYIVYMTYDLHGQWDAGNEWSMPNCPSGACLRSHVNWTETHNALSMITKAGVPASKILMGVSTYGRSFKMAQAGCDGPECSFLGDRLESPAKPGRCTDTGGYLSNAEIFEQIDKGYTRKWSDIETRSNYLVYDGTEWVSYMDDAMRQWRETQAKRLNFGGTIEWAIDLQEFLENDGRDDTRDLWHRPEKCKDETPHDTIQELINDLKIPLHCMPIYALEVLEKMASRALQKYHDLIDDDYDRNFEAFRRTVHRSADDRLWEWFLKSASTYFDCTLDRDGSKARCPPEGNPDASTGNYTFHLRAGDSGKFYEDVLEKHGLTQQQVYFGPKIYRRTNPEDPGGTCVGITGCVTHWFRQVPTVNYAYFKQDDIPNPKDVIEPSVDGAGDITATLWGYRWAFQLGLIQEDMTKVVDAYTIPVLLIEESVEAMQEAHDMGEEIREDEMTNFILLIVETVLFIIPLLGKVVGSAVRTAVFAYYIRAAANIVGDLGLIATDIYKVEQAETDEERAVLGLGIAITGMGTLTNIPTIRAAGKTRKDVPNPYYYKITKKEEEPKFRSSMESVQGEACMITRVTRADGSAPIWPPDSPGTIPDVD
ncbi:hypothetical protein FDECE_4591 [Fusarium decemcellulare]|nr:hypothetical protein FDECE_4591 [Fusarium decemcellulare]